MGQTHANLGCGGIPREGVGALSAPIAGIADIARHRRNREGLPLIQTDDADKRNPETFTAKVAEDAKEMGQTHANLGCVG